MKLSILSQTPETLFTMKYTDGTTPLYLAMMPDGAMVRASFLPKGTAAAQAEKITEITAQWQRRFPHTAFTPAPRSMMPDTARGLLAGTEFQLKVWKALAKLKPGATTTYAALALATGHPKAVRAVGTAVGANPLAPFIPCHRVLAMGGGLGGFAGGLPLKIELLAAEGIAA